MLKCVFFKNWFLVLKIMLVTGGLFKKTFLKASIAVWPRQLITSNVRNCFNDNEKSNKSAESDASEASKLARKRYQLFDDRSAEIILDNSIDLEVFLNQKQKREKVNLRTKQGYVRGKQGVFDIEELIDLLREEKMQDIATIQVPKELKYCDYMVLCNATSLRHIKAFTEVLNQIYKIKKDKSDKFLNLNDNSKDWKLIDMNNIILNIFLPQIREFYDLETLWTVGEKYDDKIQRPETDVLQNILNKHQHFIEQQLKSSPN